MRGLRRIAPRLRTCARDISSRSIFTIPISTSRPFTPDGILDYGSGDVKGREAIKVVIARMPNPAATAGLRAAAARHNISNLVLKVDGDKAFARSYWFHYSNDNPQRKGVFSISVTTPIA
jgi:SnoaL-like domain